MDIVILSGKGGTGKTTLSVNLAAVAGSQTALLDCDVEEPNGHLFMKSGHTRLESVTARYPVIDEEICTHCGKCAVFCSFNALLSTKRMNIVMAELCHDCGGCALVCPVKAISYSEREVGFLGRSLREEGGSFVDGIINTGEYSAEKIIERVLKEPVLEKHRIIDAPPGCACSAVTASEVADYALIVTEPTPFALSDMKMIVEMLRKLSLPMGVFINKAGENEEDLLAYCREENLQVMGKLNFSEEYGKTCTKGHLLVKEHEEVSTDLKKLWKEILKENL